MGNTKKIMNNENGSTTVTVLIILAILTIIGISSVTTSTIELQISHNERVHQMHFNQAESAAHEAAQRIDLLDSISDYDDLMPTTSSLGWMNDGTLDLKQSSQWDAPLVNVSQALIGNAGEVRFAADYAGKQPGSSIKSGEVSINLYSLYGLSRNNRGNALINVGSKKPVLNP